jgi:tetratricopeptide (TPR) repeat protein
MFPEIVAGFVTTLSTGLATRAGEAVAGATADAWSSLVATVRHRLGADPGTSGALAAVEQSPQSLDARAALIAALLRVATEDPEFAERFQSLWQRAQVEISAESGGVASQFTSSGSGLTQAGRDVTVNYLPLPVESATVPRQVRAFVGSFFDRVTEMATMRRLLTGDRSTGVTMVMLVGLPGAGKRALTSRGVALLGDRYPGGHVHIDFAALSGRSGGAAVSEATAKALRAVGVDERFVPPGLVDQVELFRSRTAGRAPMLMVLDGVSDSAQVQALVPSAAGSAVVVTTQYRIADLVRKGAKVIEVKALPAVEAVALLADMCGDDRVSTEPAAAEEIVRWCGGLAEALRVAGARLALDSSLTVTDLAEELTAEAGRLDALSLPGWAATGVAGTVAATFAVSYGRLPADAQQLYRGLGAIELDDCTAELAAAVTGAADSTAAAALETLADASLLERTTRGRYRMHPLVRLHAARQAAVEGPNGRAATLRRVVASCLAFTAWADRAIMGDDRLRVGQFDPLASGRPSPFPVSGPRPAALAALEAERANLLAVVRTAADAGLDEPVWQLALALTALYLNHRHHTDWIEATRLAVQAARLHGRHDVVARLCSLVSRAYQDLGDLPAARAQIEAALAALSHVDDPALVASVWELHGRYLEHVDRTEAEAAYRKALAFNIEAGQQRGAALVRYFLGVCLDTVGRPEEALALMTEAYDWLRDHDDRMAARCQFSLGVARQHAGDLAQASRDLRAAADYFAVQGLWHYEVPARESLADLAGQLGDRDSERREIGRAVEVEEATGGQGFDRLRRRLDRLR